MAATIELIDAPAAAPMPAPPGRGRWWWLARLDVWAGLLVVAACCAFIFVQLEPSLLFRNTTPSGGDTAAHVWWPAYLRDHLLRQFRLAGWSPDFYAGFPAGQFYFPVPGAADRRARRLPSLQHRVQARHRARPDPAPGRRLRVRTRHTRATPDARRVRGRRDRLPVLHRRSRYRNGGTGLRVQPAHHGRDAGEHPRRRVLVHDRARVRPRVLRDVRVVAADGRARAGSRLCCSPPR